MENQLGEVILGFAKSALFARRGGKTLTKVEIQPYSSVLFEQSKNIVRSRENKLTADICQSAKILPLPFDNQKLRG